jgi:Ulp1 family protease
MKAMPLSRTQRTVHSISMLLIQLSRQRRRPSPNRGVVRETTNDHIATQHRAR